jgi:hypothetical protein
LIALVTDQAPRKLNVNDFKRGLEIFENKFPTNILAIKMNHSVKIILFIKNAKFFLF